MSIIQYGNYLSCKAVLFVKVESEVFSEFGHCYEEKNSAISVSFKKINQYRRAISKGEGVYPVIFENS